MKRDRCTQKLREMIDSGKFSKGMLLPSERVLAAELGVSRITLRKALEPLVQEGVLENQPGRGTLVSETPSGDEQLKLGWKIIALLLPDISNRFFGEVAESIEYAALQRGYQILLCNSRHRVHLEEFHIRNLVQRRVDGVILAHDPHEEVPKALSQLQQAGIPTVLLFTSAEKSECDSVVLDDRAGVEQALRYLWSLGHRRIGFCRPLAGEKPHIRETYFQEAMARNGWRVPAEHILDVVGRPEDEFAATVKSLHGKTDGPTAFLCGNDHVALMLVRQANSLGIEIPRQLSIVGFDNLRFVEHLPVPLTTVDQPKQAMGRRAAEILFERISEGPQSVPHHEVFTPHLVIRESCSVPQPVFDRATRPADVIGGAQNEL